MTCPHSSRAEAYRDGELPPAEAREFESHLETCGACRAEVAALRALSRRLAEAPLPRPSEAAMRRWASSFREVEERRVRRLAGWLSSAAAVLLAATMLGSMRDPEPGLPPIGAVEAAALMPDDETAPPTLLAAQWMAADLSIGQRGGASR